MGPLFVVVSVLYSASLALVPVSEVSCHGLQPRFCLILSLDLTGSMQAEAKCLVLTNLERARSPTPTALDSCDLGQPGHMAGHRASDSAPSTDVTTVTAESSDPASGDEGGSPKANRGTHPSAVCTEGLLRGFHVATEQVKWGFDGHDIVQVEVRGKQKIGSSWVVAL